MKKIPEEKKEQISEEKPAKNVKRTTPNTRKIQHVGLNGEVSSLETDKPTQNKPLLSGLNASRKSTKVTVVESSSLKVTAANNDKPKPVRVMDKNSPAVLDAGAVSFGGRCKYPENFRPFPQRNKQPSRSRILYGNMSEKGAKRMDAFQGRKETRQGFNNGLAVNSASDSKRS